ncbi:hypothetical protein [Streptomyces sp. KR80]|uniref:hypothetical protein n=1 Tax=Streptomyces sp. KR80 TaxID=3457426 RepID=UPI003FD5480E
MRNVIRASALGIALSGALFIAPSALADGPQGQIHMCSKNITPGILGGLFPHLGSQAESCVSSSSSNGTSSSSSPSTYDASR